jgi:hypothetical protein
MTYEERQRYQEQRQRLVGLKERLSGQDAAAPVTRREALEILALLEEVAERLSPERWDRALEAVAEEAARRAEFLTTRRG